MHVKDRSLDAIFHERTGNIYRSMVTRFKGKKNKNGRTIRIHRDIPFTQEEFRAHAISWFIGGVEGIARCKYCTVPMNASTFRCDHDIAVSVGGSIGLDNLFPCCEACNLEKGKLTGEEFIELKNFAISRLSSTSITDLFARLRQGSGYRRLMISAIKKKVVDEEPF